MESRGNVENVRRTRVRNDRILLETRCISAIIVPFLVAAFVILYLFPDHTQGLFAWVGLYFTTPFIVFLLWLRNRFTDPGPDTSHDQRMPRLVRLVKGYPL